MTQTTHPPTVTLLQRARAALVQTYTAATIRWRAWRDDINPRRVTVAIAWVVAALVLLGLLYGQWPRSAPAPAVAAAPTTTELQAQIDELTDRLTALEEQGEAEIAPSAYGPAQRPARRASDQRLPAAPAARAAGWGVTDLDRDIEAFTRSLNQEPAK
jgi:hypothetical protein